MMWSFIAETNEKRNQEGKVGGVYIFQSQFSWSTGFLSLRFI